jgi:hypothetical protein
MICAVTTRSSYIACTCGSRETYMCSRVHTLPERLHVTDGCCESYQPLSSLLIGLVPVPFLDLEANIPVELIALRFRTPDVIAICRTARNHRNLVPHRISRPASERWAKPRVRRFDAVVDHTRSCLVGQGSLKTPWLRQYNTGKVSRSKQAEYRLLGSVDWRGRETERLGQ